MTSEAGTPPALNAMLDELDEPAIKQLALLLEVKLSDEFEPFAPRDGEGSELGFLAQLLDDPEAQGSSAARTTPLRSHYDRVKPPEAPKSQTLCQRYGSWTKACRAAEALRAEVLSARPWAHGFAGKRRPRPYERDEVIRAVLKCAIAIDRIPTSNAYYTWAARERRRAKQTGKTVRYPAQASVERFFHSWGAVRETIAHHRAGR